MVLIHNVSKEQFVADETENTNYFARGGYDRAAVVELMLERKGLARPITGCRNSVKFV